MKKVLSVAMASAMVLGMGANAFAIKYNTDSNDTAKWPVNFRFDGELFVTDKDNNIVKDANTKITSEKKVDFQAGDVIWMPLYANNQIEYKSELVDKEDALAAETVRFDVTSLNAGSVVKDTSSNNWFRYENGNWYAGNSSATASTSKTALNPMNAAQKKVIDQLNAGYVKDSTKKVEANGKTVFQVVDATTVKAFHSTNVDVESANQTMTYNGVADRKIDEKSIRYYMDASEVTKDTFYDAIANNEAHTYYVSYNLLAEAGKAPVIGDALNNNVVSYGHYTGNIDKNWSVNLLEEKGTTLTDIVEKAELYKATEKDYHSYKAYTKEIAPNAVYVRVHLKDDWKFCKELDMKYNVYVADNAGHQTENKVWVSGKYAAAPAKTVDFTWSNDASKAGLWKANENGVAVFDFADKAFFTVKMYKDECLYLDLDAAYKTATAKEFDSEIDSFYYFDTENANFIREGELVIVSDNADLAVYEIAEDEIFDMEAEYVTNYAVAHTNEKINGYVFNTAELGKYVLADEIVVEDEEEAEEEDKAEEVKPSEDAKEETVKPNKVNPNTGANDFVGLAVSLAVVSVAAAGALALKK